MRTVSDQESEEALPADNENHADGGWLSGEVRCMGCQGTWETVSPIGCTDLLTCPYCQAQKGARQLEIVRDEDHWQCGCGCLHFSITPARVYCPNCGRDHKPWDDAQ